MTDQVFADACRAFALVHIPDLKRAVEERYDVTPNVLRWVCERVGELHPSLDPDDVFVAEPGARRVRFSPRPAPTKEAFALHDAVARHLDRIARPDGLEITMDRIQRVDRKLGNAPLKYTAVVVLVAPPGLPVWRVALDAEWES